MDERKAAAIVAAFAFSCPIYFEKSTFGASFELASAV